MLRKTAKELKIATYNYKVMAEEGLESKGDQLLRDA